jgi:hypothetical protein
MDITPPYRLFIETYHKLSNEEATFVARSITLKMDFLAVGAAAPNTAASTVGRTKRGHNATSTTASLVM